MIKEDFKMEKYNVIEITRIFNSGTTQILKVLDFDNVESINVNHNNKSIEIHLKKVDNIYMTNCLSFKDDDNSYVNIRFTFVTKLNY